MFATIRTAINKEMVKAPWFKNGAPSYCGFCWRMFNLCKKKLKYLGNWKLFGNTYSCTTCYLVEYKILMWLKWALMISSKYRGTYFSIVYKSYTRCNLFSGFITRIHNDIDSRCSGTPTIPILGRNLKLVNATKTEIIKILQLHNLMWTLLWLVVYTHYLKIYFFKVF